MAKTSAAPEQSGRRVARAPEDDVVDGLTRRSLDGSERTRAWVLGAAVALLLAQLVFRAWAAWSSWYSTDDLGFLREWDRGSQWSYLMEPYNGHLMPGGKLVYWAVGSAGSAQWWPAAVFLVVGQALASTACLWMLVTLFGRRWAIVPPFALYLFLCLSMPAYVWFVAATQQLPLQIVLSLGVGSWVRYLRGEGRRWLVATLTVLAVGMVFREKAMLVLPILIFVSLFYFTEGGIGRRLRGLRRQAVGIFLIAALGATYVVTYLDQVPSQASAVTPRVAGELAGTLLGSTLVTGLVGGPWQWRTTSSTNSFADPPEWAVGAAWLVSGVVILYVLLRRRRSWPALLLFAGYIGGTYLLVLSARGSDFGASLGVDTRYLSDIPVVLCLCLALATADLHGAPGSSEVREPEVVAQAPAWLVTTLVVAMVIGGVASSVAYVRPWHTSAAHDFFDRFDRELTARGEVDLADRVLPEPVMSRYFAPSNTVSFLAPLSTGGARFPDSSSSLFVVGDDGGLRPAKIDQVLASRPGEVEGCGWRVTEKGKSIPLTAQAPDDLWWIRIGYLTNGPSVATVSAGDETFDVSLRSGLNDLFLRVEDSFDSVRIDGIEPGVAVCVGTIEVGKTRPGGPA
jgi:hypothetical protein